MRILLNEIPKEGLELDLNLKSEGLKSLKDDLGDGFEAKLQLTPAGDAYELRGKITTQIPVTCSYCAHDYKMAVSEKVHEIFLTPQKKSHSLVDGGNSVSDPDMGVTELEKEEILLGEYIREIIGLAEPFQPPCEQGNREKCTQYEVFRKEAHLDCESEKSVSSSPFAILNNLKPKN